jgi:hypothetical protein
MIAYLSFVERRYIPLSVIGHAGRIHEKDEIVIFALRKWQKELT